MKSFKNIVVGIDYSEASKMALKQAGRIASEEGSQLIALHVVVPSEIEEYQRYYTVPSDDVLKAFRAGIENLVEAELGSRDAARCEAVIGVPYRGLVECTETNNSDLLVLGSRGNCADAHDVGFFAVKCIRHSKIPVLLNRMRHRTPFKRVVACVDFSEATPEVIEIAARLAVDENAEMHVVHAVCPPWMRATHVLYDLQTSENDDFKAQYQELLDEQMAAAVRSSSQFPALKIHQHVLKAASPSQAIVNFLRDRDADLVVVGRSGHTGAALKQYIVGTTAERLIHRSPCSVVTVPCSS